MNVNCSFDYREICSVHLTLTPTPTRPTRLHNASNLYGNNGETDQKGNRSFPTDNDEFSAEASTTKQQVERESLVMDFKFSFRLSWHANVCVSENIGGRYFVVSEAILFIYVTSLNLCYCPPQNLRNEIALFHMDHHRSFDGCYLCVDSPSLSCFDRIVTKTQGQTNFGLLCSFRCLDAILRIPEGLVVHHKQACTNETFTLITECFLHFLAV